jgi:hypothetical protein
MDEKPTKGEVRAQLDQILASSLFASADTQSRILKLIVEKALEGEPIKGIDLKLEIGGTHAEDSHLDRQTASIVRQKVEKYYQAVGFEDFVRIELPAGPSYKADFSYNVSSKAMRIYQLGLSYRAEFSWDAFELKISAFRQANELAPEFAPPYAALAETLLLREMWENVFHLASLCGGTPSRFARGAGLKYLELSPNSWRAHLILGLEAIVHLEMREAHTYFKTALDLNRSKTKSDLRYATYLMVTGSVAEGLEITRIKFVEQPGSQGVHLVYMFFLYAADRSEEALELLHIAPDYAAYRVIADVVGILISIELGDPQVHFAIDKLNQIPKFIQSASWIRKRFVGLKILLLTLLADWGWEKELLEETIALKTERQRCSDWFVKHRPLPIPEKGDRAYDEYVAAITRRPLDWVFVHIARGNIGRALACLRRAYRERDSALAWIQILPIFRPLRDHPRFLELVAIVAADEKLDRGLN